MACMSTKFDWRSNERNTRHRHQMASYKQPSLVLVAQWQSEQEKKESENVINTKMISFCYWIFLIWCIINWSVSRELKQPAATPFRGFKFRTNCVRNAMTRKTNELKNKTKNLFGKKTIFVALSHWAALYTVHFEMTVTVTESAGIAESQTCIL